MKVTVLKNQSQSIFVNETTSYSYHQAYKAINNFSQSLPTAEYVAIYGDNSAQWVCALYAAWEKGACVIPIDSKCDVKETAFILNDACPTVLCTTKANLEVAKEAVALCSHKVEIFILEDIIIDETSASGEFEIAREDNELALIVYTSGTTGNPKGVLLTFLNLRANLEAVVEAGYFFQGVRVLTMLPFHHILPLMGTIIAPIYAGGTLNFPKTLSPADISALLQIHPVDLVVTVPRFYELVHSSIKDKIRRSALLKFIFFFAKIISSEKISRRIFNSVHKKFGGEVKFWITGGASLDKVVAKDLLALGFVIREGYGMTECAPIIAFPRPGKFKIGSPGQSISCNELRIVDGEIVVRGLNVTEGYYNRPEETAEQIRNGWLYTGDIGYIDDDGFLFITGRRKELIVLPNGKKVNPIEMESRLVEQSSDALEIGVLSYENILQAIVRVKEELYNSLDKDALIEKIRDSVILPYNRNAASYKRIIRFVCTTKELPRTRIGKMKRHLLPSYIESIKDDIPTKLLPEPESDIYKFLKKYIGEQSPVPPTADGHLEMDLGLDSLGKISLHCLIKENYHLDLQDKDFENNPTLRTLSAFIESTSNAISETKSTGVSWTDIIKNHKTKKLPFTNFFHFITIIIFKFFTKKAYKLNIQGEENIPTTGSAILAVNHQSYMDAVFVCMPMSKTRIYTTYFYAKIRKVLRSGFIRYFAKHSNVIIMDHDDNLIESIQSLVQVLKKDNLLVIFPEGTRTHTGEVGEFKQTFAILAKELNLPIIPVSIKGAFEALKSRSSLPKFGSEISITYKTPIIAQEGETYESLATRVKEEVEN